MGRHALLLGTSICHTDPALRPLPPVRHDVTRLQALLDSDGEFDTVRAELDLPAARLRQTVEEFFGARRTGDLALFYYSGHGVLHDDRQSLFLAAVDTIAAQPHATAFDVDGILRHLLNITKASQKVVLLDCCFSGAFTARARFSGGLREEPRRSRRERGTFFLTSSNHMEASKTQGADQPSVFTDVLLEGLRGAAAGLADDGWITTNDLSRYVPAEMARRRRHTPVESSEGITEPIRLVAVADPAAAGRRVKPVTASPADDAPFDADRWRRLMEYYIGCMRRSAVLQSFIDPDKGRTFIPGRAGAAEGIFSTTEPVPLGRRALALAELARADGKEMAYGYPVVAVRVGRQRNLRLAPLLVCDLSVGDDGLFHPSPPWPSPALVDHFQLSPVEAEDLHQQVERVFARGDRAALTATVDLLMTTFGLTPMVALDPTALSGRADRGPIDRVQNTAVLYLAGTADSPERALIEDLREIAKNPGQIGRTALAALAEHPASPAVDAVPTVALNPVNEAQEEIIQSAMAQRLTVAQGPPGTGKSQLVTALLATATAAGQSVLIGSTNNQAVDAVTGRIDELIGPGLLLRTGNKEHRLREPERLAQVLTAYPPDGQAAGVDDRTPRHELRLLADEIAELRQGLDRRRLVERDLADLAVERRSIAYGDHNPALPADDAALARLFHLTDRALASRWFGWWYRRRLRSHGTTDPEAIATLGKRVVIELRWRERQRRLAELPDPEMAWQRLVQAIGKDRPAYSVELLRAQIARRVAAGARLLRDRADEMSKPDQKSWSFFPALLGVLPGWAVTALSARRLPPRPAMYDLVVIDEAAQCTIPAILPLLYRAKRALIIGDPRQLAAVVDLPESEDRTERVKAGLGSGWLDTRRLTYAGHSGYDAFAAVAGAALLLDEHYRCHPDIIDVPNRQIYQGRLTVLTDPARLAAPTATAVRWRDVPGEFRRGETGSGHNDAEVSGVLAEVRELRAAHPDATIGVVTPLAAHRSRLDRALRAASLDDNLLCATIHKFQGSERDIMVISPVGAQGVPDRTRGWLVHQTNLWNVAITRAQSQLVVVGDRSWWSSQRGLLSALAVERRPDGDAPDDTPGPADRLHAALRRTDLAVRRDVTLSGHRADLVVRRGDGELAIVVDDPAGNPDGRVLRKTLARLDIIRGRTPVRRIPAWRCLAEPDLVATELSHALQPSTHTP